MKKILLIGCCLLSGCFAMPYGYMQQTGAVSSKSAEQKDQQIDAQYTAPLLSIKVEGEGHTVNIPEKLTIVSSDAPNKIEIGSKSKTKMASQASYSVTKKESIAFTIILLIVLYAIMPKIWKAVKAVFLHDWAGMTKK